MEGHARTWFTPKQRAELWEKSVRLTRCAPARSIPSLCRRCKIRTRRRRRPRNCSRANQRHFLGRRARSAAISTAASPALCRCRSLDLPGKSCGCRVTATGAIRNSFASSNGLPRTRKRLAGTVFWLATCRSRAAGRCSPTTPAIKSASTSDIWFTPMPNHVQSREEREFGSATDVVAPDLRDVDPEVWTHRHTALIRTAAQDPAVTRILVNAAIKKALCREAGADRAWLYKVRPWYGHAEHFHV